MMFQKIINKLFLMGSHNSQEFFNCDGEKIKKQFIVKNGYVKKYSSSNSYLEIDIIKFFVNYYKKYIPEGDFNLQIIEKSVYFSHKIMDISILQYFVPKKKLFNKTERLFGLYINAPGTLLYNIKQINPNISKIEVHVGEDKYKAKNYFKYKNSYWLLDIENFYFKIYDKYGNIIDNLDDISQIIPKIVRYNGGKKRVFGEGLWTI